LRFEAYLTPLFLDCALDAAPTLSTCDEDQLRTRPAAPAPSSLARRQFMAKDTQLRTSECD
jgi:hypothetical protein